MNKKVIKKPKIRKGAWFYPVRGSYLPCSWQGWLTYVPFTLFLLAVLIAAFRTQDSVSDALYMIFPEWIAAAVVMTWIARLKS